MLGSDLDCSEDEKWSLMDLDLIGFGSAILDFAPINVGLPLSEVQGFTPCAGGAVANTIVAASRLGIRTGFVGCVGDDEFGTFVLRDFERERVNISHVRRITGMATGIAFYALDKNGERRYVFYRFPGYSDPESTLKPDDIDAEYIARSRAIHFSEAMLRRGSSRDAMLKALQISKKHGVKVSYDPNVRPVLWSDKNEFREVQRKILGFTDVFLSTDDELMLITDTKSMKRAVEIIMELGPSILVIRHRDYYRVITANLDSLVRLFEVRAVDTSGAGDAFDAGFLTGLLKKWPLDKAIELGSAVAALKVMVVGTRKGLPRMEEALEFIKIREASRK